MKLQTWQGHALTGRQAVAGAMIVLGLGRLGLFTVGSVTFVPAPVYGLALLLVGGALLLTAHARRFGWQGRISAALGAGVMAGLGVDVGPVNTSAIMLYWLAVVLLVEAGVRREC